MNIFYAFIFLQFFFLSFISFGIAEGKIEIGFENQLDSEGVPIGWKLKEKTGEADFKILREDGENIAYFKSISSSFSLEKPIHIDPYQYPYIYWKWKIIKLPLGGDVRIKGKNDQAAQLLIAFDRKKIISYIWDTSAPEGSVHDESIGWPINLEIKVVTVKSGTSDLNKWVSFKRNIFNDFRKLYGENPTLIKGIRIQINSQHTKSVTEAFFGKILFQTN